MFWCIIYEIVEIDLFDLFVWNKWRPKEAFIVLKVFLLRRNFVKGHNMNYR